MRLRRRRPRDHLSSQLDTHLGSVMTMNTTLDKEQSAEELRQDAIWYQRCDVLHKAWVQIRYNRRRQRFFDLLDKVTKSITVVLGASLMGQYFREYLPWLASAITSLGLLALVFGYGDRKQQHKDLAEQASKIVESIKLVPSGALSYERTAAWEGEYARLIAKSPPSLKALSLICEREQATADGNPNHVPALCWCRRFISDFF